MTPARVPAALLGACAALVLLVVVAFAVGRFPVSAGDLANILWAHLTGERARPRPDDRDGGASGSAGRGSRPHS